MIKVNTRKVDGMQNTKALKSQTGLFVFNLLGSQEPLKPLEKADEIDWSDPLER